MDDLISRKALIAEYDRVHIGPAGGARKLMEDAPAVQKWIPATERLPDYGQQVIVYLGNLLSKHVMAYQFWSEDFSTWAFVTHWMPLPEPPKGE